MNEQFQSVQLRLDATLRRVAVGGLQAAKSCKSTLRWRVLACILLFALLPGVAQSQDSSQSQSLNGAPYTIKSNVDSVVLHPIVRDRRGGLVSGLGKDDFHVYENGVLQQIDYFSHEDIPVTVGLVVDNSGSMGPKRPEVIAASLAFVRSSNPRDQVFVINFNEHVSFGLPANMPFTDQMDPLEIALSRTGANGMTALYDALAAGIEHLKNGDRDKKALLVVSDGADNASKHTFAQTLTMTEQSDVIIYTLGVFDTDDPDRNPRVLRQFSRATGGEAFFPHSVSAVVPICEQIARDIRSQYIVAYTPTNRKQDGAYRVIKVEAGAPGRGRLTVRVRAGYYAPVNAQSIPVAKAIDHETQE